MNLDRRDPQPRRRTIVLTLALLLAVLAAAQPLSAAGPRAERKNRKLQTVTRTFANTTPIAIVGQKPAAPYPSLIDVSGFRKGKVKDVNLRLLSFGHEFPDDVDILLVAPSGQHSIMMSDVGGVDRVFDLDLTLDDQAPNPIPDDGPLISGAFQPEEREFDSDDFPPPAPPGPPNAGLFVFNGSNPNGTWSLFVSDDAPSDDGTIANGWELTVRADVVKGGKGKGKKK